MKISKTFYKLDVEDILNEYAVASDKEKVVLRLAKEYQCDQQLIHAMIAQQPDPDHVSRKGIKVSVDLPELTDSKNNSQEPSRKGEKRVMRSGEAAVIIEYHSSKNIDVEFEDGTRRYGVEYGQFCKGQVAKIPRKHRKASAIVKPVVIPPQPSDVPSTVVKGTIISGLKPTPTAGSLDTTDKLVCSEFCMEAIQKLDAEITVLEKQLAVAENKREYLKSLYDKLTIEK